MARNPSREAILDGMVDALSSVVPRPGEPVAGDKFIYQARRYMGELTSEEAFKRGVAGRCPAVLVAFSGEKTIKTTIGRRTDRTEDTFAAICITDARRGRDERRDIFDVVEKVKRLMAARGFGLGISPLRYRTEQSLIDADEMLAHALYFTARYWRDYTVDVTETLEGYDGELKQPREEGGATVEGMTKTFA